MEHLARTPWSAPPTVAGFATAAPNARLLAMADVERRRLTHGRALDLGCGAGRNLLPLARRGWEAVGVDLSRPMLHAAAERLRAEATPGRCHLVQAAMDALPIRDHGVDLVVAHGIWNLARSAHEFRRGVQEAARVARAGALLFVFTFSRRTISATSRPVDGETFVFTEFSGQAQCFLTAAELVDELGAAGFDPDPQAPLVEHNVPPPGTVHCGAPVIYEGGFRVRPARR